MSLCGGGDYDERRRIMSDCILLTISEHQRPESHETAIDSVKLRVINAALFQ